LTVSTLANSPKGLNGVSSHMIRKKHYPIIRGNLWGNALWSPSCFAGSCGGAPIEIIRQYIEQPIADIIPSSVVGFQFSG
jgi:putative transposase